MKDYYAILEVPVTASVAEIKQAYRKLVMIYHPDKNNAELYAAARFNEIKEAYETLINPAKKEQYLQQRWLRKAGGKHIGENLITPPAVLKQALTFNKEVAEMDVYRMNYISIVQYIKELMNTEVMEKLVAFDEKEINQTILHTVTKVIQVLPLKHTKEIIHHLSPFVQKDEQAQLLLQQLLQQKQQQQRREMMMPVYILLLVAALCLLIWFSGKQ